MAKKKENKDRQHNGQYKKNRRTDNAMANTKRTERQTTQWPIQKEQKDRQHKGQCKKNRRTDNTMANTKITDGQNTTQKTKD